MLNNLSRLLIFSIILLHTLKVTSLLPGLGLPILSCDNSCLTCTGPNPTQCSTCLSGLLPLGGACVCADGSYYTGGLAPCDSCSTSCVTCDGPAVSDCLTCTTGYNLYQGTCYAPCTSTQYFDTTALSCQTCNSLCLTCNGAGASKCTSCQTATLTSGACVCPVGQYTIALGGCANCHATCKGCSGSADNQCTSCNTGMILQSGKCVCSTGTYLVPGPPAACQACDSRCLGCSGSTSNDCTSCRSGFELSGTQCNCPSGYYYNSGTLSCVACFERCTGCFGTASNQCTACKNNLYYTPNQCNCQDGKYLDTTLMTCRNCDQSCLKCSGPSSSQCTDCASGFTLTSGQCLCTGGLCSCPSGTYADTGTNTCQPCDPTCKECSGPSSNQCTDCWNDFTLSGSVCTCGTPPCTCPAGTYYDSGTCKKCYATCQTCSGGTANDCTDCVNDLVLFTSTCGCSPGYYMHPSLFCFPCHSTCQTCSGPSASECILCKSGMVGPSPLCTCASHSYWDSGTSTCPTCDANCKDCEGPEMDQCTSCYTGKTLDNKICLADCASNQYRDTLTDRSCQPCDPTCKTCSGGSSTECLSCLAPRTFSSGSCPDLTSAGCHYTCKTCLSASSSECLTCPLNMVLVEVEISYGYCSDSCPTGYYLITENSQAKCRKKIRLDNRLAYGPKPFMVELTYDKDIAAFSDELMKSIEVAIEFRSDQPLIDFRYDLAPTSSGKSLMLTLTFYGHLLPKNNLRIKYILPTVDSSDNKTSIYVVRQVHVLRLIEFFEDTTGTSDVASAFANATAIGQVANAVFAWTSSIFLRSVHALRSEIVEDMIGYFIFMDIDYTPNFVEFAEQGLGAFELLMPNLFMPIMEDGVGPDDDPDTTSRILESENGHSHTLRYNRYRAGRMRMLLSKETETLFNMRLDDREFLINHGAATSLLLIALGAIIVVDIIKFIIDKTCKPGRLRRYIRATSVALKWNFIVGHYSSEYQGFIFFSIVQLVVNEKPTEKREVLTFIFGMLSFLFSTLAVMAAFLVARRANIKLKALEEAPTSEKEDIDTDLKRIGLFFESFREEAYMQLLYPGLLVTRCFGFGIVLVFLTDYPYVQITYLLLSTLGIIAYLAYIKPLKKSAQNKLTILYECFFLAISGLALLLHVYNGVNIQDVETRSWICFMMLTIGTSMIVLNLISLALELLEFRKLFFKDKAKVAPETDTKTTEKQPAVTANSRSTISIPNFASDAEEQPIKGLRKDLKALYSPTKKPNTNQTDDEEENLASNKRETLVDLLNGKKMATKEDSKKRNSSKIFPDTESNESSVLVKTRSSQMLLKADLTPKRPEGKSPKYVFNFNRLDSSQMSSGIFSPSKQTVSESQNLDTKPKQSIVSRHQVPTLLFEDLGKNNNESHKIMTFMDLEGVDSVPSKRVGPERRSVNKVNNSFQSLKPPDMSRDEVRANSLVLHENDVSQLDKWMPPKSAERNRLDVPASPTWDGVVVPRKMIQVKDNM